MSSATSRQLQFVRSLAEQTGTSFTYPKTRGQASREIERLLTLKESGHTSRSSSPQDKGPDPVYATAVQPGEVVGFGSAASWHKEPALPTPPPADIPSVGKRTELGRYTVRGVERVLYGHRINGCVRITDKPASGAGRSYLVERNLQHDKFSALKALVAGYIDHALELDEIPMASSAVRRDLAAVIA